MIPGLGSPVKNKKNLASFYTPQRVAQILVDWVITDDRTTILDPSFGGCAFLYSALEALSKMRNPAPGKQIYGVDIDPDAQAYLEPLILAGATHDQFVISDFFNITPDHLNGMLFDAVVGNPPYIRHHDISDEAQDRALTRLKSFNIQISKRASYWAFFLLYSMQFLRQGGRLAMVLPSAFLHTNYSTQVRELLIQHFEQVTIFLLQERIFDGTDEESILICAAGAQKPHRILRIGAVRSVEDLERAFGDIQASTRKISNVQGDSSWLHTLIEPESLTLYDQLLGNPNVIRMGKWVKARIGVVTGSNDFFILSRAEQKRKGIPDRYLIPVARRPSHFTGLWVRDEDLQALAKNGNKNLLLTLNQMESSLPKRLQEYIQYGQQIGVSKARKCRERNPWYVVSDPSVSSAFMPCMVAAWPRLVVNQSQYTCTNNILRVFWKEERPVEDWLRLALGTLSTLSQLSAELVGRSYGGGVLKLEPNELTRLVVPLLPVENIVELSVKVDFLLRQNKLSEATDVVDSALLDSNIGLTIEKIEQLRTARDWLFLRRRKTRENNICSNLS